jgi:predicted GH43/DUF377 family glycosyl hydrolase
MVKLERFDGNPILTPTPEHSFEARNTSNPGATIFDDKVHVLYRCGSDQERWAVKSSYPITYIGLAISSDGFHVDERRDAPILGPEPRDGLGEHGIQDTRVARIDDAYYLTSATVSRWGDRLILHTTRDFETFERVGFLQPEVEMRTAGLFPQKFGDEFCVLLRYEPSLWIGYTRDFKTWRGIRCIFDVKLHSWYGQKLGMSCTPIRQDDAWLLFWHGKDDRPPHKYRLGVMWLDLDDPSRILCVQEEPILEPETDYETTGGLYPYCCYACGAVEKDGRYLVYYGAADHVACVASVPVEDCLLRNQ